MADSLWKLSFVEIPRELGMSPEGSGVTAPLETGDLPILGAQMGQNWSYFIPVFMACHILEFYLLYPVPLVSCPLSLSPAIQRRGARTLA